MGWGLGEQSWGPDELPPPALRQTQGRLPLTPGEATPVPSDAGLRWLRGHWESPD